MGRRKKPITEKIIHFKCPNCKSEHIKVITRGEKYIAVICADCKKIIKQINADDVKAVNDLYNKIEEQYGGQKALKRMVKICGNWIMRCSRCRCQLYNSGAEEPVGQFNLKGAKFCPQCGAELF